MKYNFTTAAACAALLLLPTCLSAQIQAVPQTVPTWDTYSDTWVAVDGLGRALPTFAEAGPPRPNKQLGTFYFLWLPGGDYRDGPYDNSRILAADPDALNHPKSPLWGGVPGFHYWGEPLFGYYNIADPFILRKHVQMLNDAGIDMLLFDTSNGGLYESHVDALIAVYRQMQKEGQKTPQLAFHMVASDGPKLIEETTRLYNEYYKSGKNDDLWFRWKGKPVIVATPVPGLGPEILNYFTFRKSYWNGRHPGPGSWNTDGYYPTENPGEIMHDETGKVEQMGVATASSIIHAPISTQGAGAGRNWHLGVKTGNHVDGPGVTAQGVQFQDEYDYARKLDPDFILTYSWNEWIAQRFVDKGVTNTYFVDQFDEEYSKDIEPMRGGFGDDYYYQLVANDRLYKGVRPLPRVSPHPISLDAGFGQWRDVQPEFRDDIGDPINRDYPGWNRATRYVNHTGRNDIVAAKVSVDSENVYFYVRTKDKLTPRTDPNWMILLINSDADYKTGWLGYDYMVNRVVDRDTTMLERNNGGLFQWQESLPLNYRVSGNEMMVAIPRKALGITSLPATIDFKWADNCLSADPTWADFTLNGDAAPNDRFNYRAKLVEESSRAK